MSAENLFYSQSDFSATPIPDQIIAAFDSDPAYALSPGKVIRSSGSFNFSSGRHSSANHAEKNTPTSLSSRFDLQLTPRGTPNLNFRRRSPMDFQIAQMNADVIEADQLEVEFYRALGTNKPERTGGQISFKPWLERAKFERLRRACADLSPEEQTTALEQLKQESIRQLETNLRERYSSEKSSTTFIIHGNKLRSALFPTEDFETVLVRGVEYLRSSGSKEIVREENELEGFRKKQEVLCDPNTPVGTREILCSPPGLIEGTSYTKKFVDILELKADEQGNRYIEAVRFSSGLTYEGYQKSLIKLKPNYFEGNKIPKPLPIDAYILSHPVVVPPDERIGSLEALYDVFFERDYKAKGEELMQEVLRFCRPLTLYSVDQLCQDVIDWREYAKSFKATIVAGDSFLEQREREISRSSPPQPYYDNQIHLASTIVTRLQKLTIEEQVAFLAMQTAESRASGCGSSEVFSIGGMSSAMEIISMFSSAANFFKFSSMSSRVEYFGIYSSNPDFCIKCPACNREIRCIVKKGGRCPSCKTVKQCG